MHPARLLSRRRQWLDQRRQLLQALSPRHLLARGFSLLRDSDGQVLRSVKQLQPGAGVTAELADGRVALLVKAVEPDGPNGTDAAEGPDP